jgi:AraC-like DNA-binding protein
MNFIPVVPALLFKAATTAVDNMGSSSQRVVEKLNVPLWQYHESHSKVPGSHFYTLVGQAARILGAEEFGYLVASYTPITALDDFSQQLGKSLTVYEAVKTFNRLYAQMSSIDYFGSVEDGEGLWWLRKRVQAADRAGSQQMELGALNYMIQTVRLGAGPNWVPEKVCLEAESLSSMDRLSEFGNAVICQGQGVSGFLIPRSVFVRSIPSERSSILPLNAGKLFSEVSSSEFSVSLRQIVRSYLSFGHPRIEEIANVTGMSVRTLQRRLKKNGLTYKRVVDQARYQASADLLCDQHVKLIDIAEELGYSDQANFNRAFRRFAGISPGKYRLLILEDRGSAPIDAPPNSR